MSNSLCKSSVFKAYQDVIADVIQNVREHFLEDGLDETILQELKSLWETKLAATKAVEEVKEVDKIIAVNNKVQKLQQQNQQNYLNQLAQQQNQGKQLVGQVPPNNHIPQGIAFPEWRRVPVQLTIPSPPGCGSTDQRVLGIEVPEVFLQGHHLKSILTGPIISATLNLPIDAATSFLQDQVNNAFLKHQQSTNFININMGVNPSIVQTDGCSSSSLGVIFRRCHCEKRRKIKKGRQFLDSHVPAKSKRQTNEHCKAKEKLPPFSSLMASISPEHSFAKPNAMVSILNTVPSRSSNETTNNIAFNFTDPINNVTSSCDIVNNIPIQRLYQVDGARDSSDDDDLDDEDEDDNDNDDDDTINDDIEEETQEVAEDEPLNSEDDVSDADGTEESFETENVIVCQFDKITRARNRWKFHLKDGIMNLNGQDYVFQKANGDAEW